ncbi:hypothetical protein B0H17DRAFT_491309 [Mycena rosella]|uniref:Uncharacterized protein n=1 Tax=Mycena rosella TaxID=1033263 RepID=A0AAD7DKW6_MYCRO|nr:hypothetical protein B0H17DRAFT_491309 [Mycena rosella]
MPAEASSSTPSKPTTRSSIRHSLGLAGKALVDVINKDGRDSDKAAKKGAKDTSSRRLSAVSAKPAAPRTSIGDSNRPPSIASRRTMTPDSKTVTRRRVSAAAARYSLDEQPTKPAEATPQGAVITRSATLRPRPGVSALPKYRPKSVAGESTTKPPSPTRAGVRRRLSISDDEKEEEAAPQNRRESAAEMSLRPISPLPQRAAFKVNLTSVINAASPPVIPAKAKPAPAASSKSKASPARPTKTVKMAASSNPTVPRPSPSPSSSGSFTPRTPKSPNGKAATAPRRGDKPQSNQANPLRDSPQRGRNESPLSRHSRKGSSHLSAPSEANEVGNMSHISEGNSEDSETEHVELLLAPVAAPGAPTPAMPRIDSTRHRLRAAPRTPVRSQLPSRANLSYLSPLPPDSDSPPSLRPKLAGTGSSAGRGSILSWEQLATEASRTLGEDEIASMLSEMPAPFRAGAISPHNHLEIPESPCLSTFNSPGEYGSSISQVLLPDVTPSPAVHANTSRYSTKDADVPVVDAAIVTLLRLQLVSAESIAKERLFQLQAMEEEIHNLKQARMRDAEELEKQVGHLEDELRGSFEIRERTEEDRTAHIASLEEQLKRADAFHDQSMGEIAAQTRESAQAKAESALRSQHAKTSALWSARVAGTHWAFVRDFAESELDAIKGDREVLSALLADLDEVQRRVCS